MSYQELSESRIALSFAQSSVRQELYNHNVQLRKTFDEESKKLFTDHPSVDTFCWKQCSDPDCDYEFFVDREFLINGKTFEQIQGNHDLIQAHKDIAEFQGEFDDGDLLALFGDAAKIIVTKYDVRTIPCGISSHVKEMF